MKDIENFLRNICKESAELINSSASSIYLKDGELFVMKAAFGYSERLIGKAKYKKGEGITGWIADGNIFIANSNEEIKSHPKWIGKYAIDQWEGIEKPCCGAVGIPLKSDNKVVGLIKVENKINGKYDDNDIKTLNIFGRTAIAAIEARIELINRIKGLNVFVLMPFSEDFNNVYEFSIKQTVLNLGMDCKRVDELHFGKSILDQIYKGIEKANFLIADMTDRNPNVFYEVGYAHALRKEVILLIQKVEDIPFDFKGMNHIIYNKNDLKSLNSQLKCRLEAIISGDYLSNDENNNVAQHAI